MSVLPPRRFDGRIALVTGAAGTLGTAICHRLAAEGAAIVALDKSGRRTGELVDALEAAHDGPIRGSAWTWPTARRWTTSWPG